jgi:hypothetical protein
LLEEEKTTRLIAWQPILKIGKLVGTKGASHW